MIDEWNDFSEDPIEYRKYYLYLYYFILIGYFITFLMFLFIFVCYTYLFLQFFGIFICIVYYLKELFFKRECRFFNNILYEYFLSIFIFLLFIFLIDYTI